MLRFISQEELIFENNDLISFQKLIQNPNFNINKPGSNKWTYLHRAVHFDCYEMVKYLVENGADVNAQTNIYLTPLHLCENEDIFHMLIKHGADINALSCTGRTPLHYCVKKEIVRLLLKYGADINVKTEYGYTALWHSCIFKHHEKIEELLDWGAIIDFNIEFSLISQETRQFIRNYFIRKEIWLL